MSKHRNPRSLAFYTDGDDDSFALEVVQVDPEINDQKLWALNFTARGNNYNHSLKPWNLASINGLARYRTYQEALLAGYHISELLGYVQYHPVALVWGWDNGDPVILHEIEMDQVFRWYDGQEFPDFMLIDSEFIEEIMAEKASLPPTAIH